MLLKFSGLYTRALCQEHPGTYFVFGDNLEGFGEAGQAWIRPEPNALGVATKRSPTMFPKAFFRDGDADTRFAIEQAERALELSETADVVIPVTDKGELSLGRGLGRLNETAPELYARLCEILDVGKARDFEVEMLRRSLRKTFDSRNANFGRNPEHKKTRDAELEFLVGAGQALTVVKHPLANAVTLWAFLQSTGRDPLRC